MPTHTIGVTYRGSTGTKSTPTRTFIGDGVVVFEGVIGPGAVNTQIAVAITRSAVKSLMLHTSKAITIKTNNATTPVDTITLVDGQLREWGNDESLTRLAITADVTSLFVSNAGTVAAAFTLEALVDATPGV